MYVCIHTHLYMYILEHAGTHMHTCSYAQSKDIDVAMKTNTGSYTIQRQTDRQTDSQTDRQTDS